MNVFSYKKVKKKAILFRGGFHAVSKNPRGKHCLCAILFFFWPFLRVALLCLHALRLLLRVLGVGRVFLSRWGVLGLFFLRGFLPFLGWLIG